MLGLAVGVAVVGLPVVGALLGLAVGIVVGLAVVGLPAVGALLGLVV